MKDRKKGKFKKRFLKCANGAISILLCIIITPFLSITLSIVEYARYQEVIAITEELMEITGISVLADYDPYLEDRFGLLAVSQEDALDADVNSMLEYNISTLGKQVIVNDGNTIVKGRYALSEVEILKRQIVSVSELTGPAAMLVKDLQLEKMLEQLNQVTAFSNLASTFSNMKNVTDAISSAIEALDTLKSSVSSLKGNLDELVGNAETIVTKVNDLYSEISIDESLDLPEEYTAEDLTGIAENFAENYVEDIIAVCDSVQAYYDLIETTKNSLDAVLTDAGKFKEAVVNVETVIEDATDDSPANDKVEEATDATLETVDEVVDKMDTLIDDYLKDLESSAINTAKSAIDTCYQNILDDSGLGDIMERYTQIKGGTYFDGVPLTENEQTDLLNLLNAGWQLYDEKDETEIEEYFTSLFVPNFSALNIQSIYDEISGVLGEAIDSFKTESTEKAVNLLNELADLLESLFSMELFFNPELNAFVDIGNDMGDNPYKDFLSEVGDIFTAVEKLGGLFTGETNLLDAIGAIGEIFESSSMIMVSIFNIAWSSFSGLIEVIQKLVDGDFGGIYEKLAIASYLRHNLANRTTYSNENEETSGLTGFAYENIPWSSTEGQDKLTGGFAGLVTFIENAKTGAGDDSMFKGAELEFALVGTNSELLNQTMVFMQIYALRFVLDLPSIFIDPFSTSTAAAATIGALIVYLLYMLVEPLLDTVLLVNGGNVPLVKTRCWVTPKGLTAYVSAFSSLVTENAEVQQMITDKGTEISDKLKTYSSETGDPNVGLANTNYGTHLLLLLLTADTESDLLPRLQGLIELETAAYYSGQNKTFSLDKAYTAIQIEAKVLFNPFFDVGKFVNGTSLDMEMNVKQMVSY